MTGAPLTASLESVRRLIVTKQHLAGKLPTRVRSKDIVSLVGDLGFVQWDPVRIVAPSHLIALWSRLGPFSPTLLDRLLWKDRKLLQHWMPIASIVRADDYPLFLSLMQRYPESLSRSWGRQRDEARAFLVAHARLRAKILNNLRSGPRELGEFEDHQRTLRDDGDWNPGSDAALMLFHLTMTGEVMVVGHRGNQNVYGLTEQFLPRWVERTGLDVAAFERAASERSIRALGVATRPEVHYYFVRGRYQDLKGALAALEKEGRIHRVSIEGIDPREHRYIHAADLDLLASLTAETWQPRMALLPPFDNLVGSPARSKELFNFEYVREQFLPREKRRFGTYVLPILWGERLIGRIDPRLDSATATLHVNAVFAEPDAPVAPSVAEELRETIARLADSVGAERVAYSARVPRAWKPALH